MFPPTSKCPRKAIQSPTPAPNPKKSFQSLSLAKIWLVNKLLHHAIQVNDRGVLHGFVVIAVGGAVHAVNWTQHRFAQAYLNIAQHLRVLKGKTARHVWLTNQAKLPYPIRSSVLIRPTEVVYGTGGLPLAARETLTTVAVVWLSAFRSRSAFRALRQLNHLFYKTPTAVETNNWTRSYFLNFPFTVGNFRVNGGRVSKQTAVLRRWPEYYKIIWLYYLGW